MGSCISKCMPGGNRPKFDSDYDYDYNFVQDKLVISQAPAAFIKPPAPLSTKISPSRPPPESSFSKPASSPSFFTASKCNSSSSNSSILGSTSSCSSLSTASSRMSSKDRSTTFSNDFLLSCIKENPHVLRINSSIKANSYVLPSPDRIHVRGAESPARTPVPQKATGIPAMQKRVRSSSPILTLQKSMRVTDPEGFACSQPRPSRVLRSPSPSRRFEGTTREMIGNRLSVPAPEEANSVSYMPPSTGRRKEHSRPASPNNSTTNTNRLRERVMSTRESIANQIEEIASKFSSSHDVDSSDDINNPLISLDCFIFL